MRCPSSAVIPSTLRRPTRLTMFGRRRRRQRRKRRTHPSTRAERGVERVGRRPQSPLQAGRVQASTASPPPPPWLSAGRLDAGGSRAAAASCTAWKAGSDEIAHSRAVRRHQRAIGEVLRVNLVRAHLVGGGGAGRGSGASARRLVGPQAPPPRASRCSGGGWRGGRRVGGAGAPGPARGGPATLLDLPAPSPPLFLSRILQRR